MREFSLRMIDGTELQVYEWSEVKDPIAIVQLVHGASEYMLRYDDFAKRMNAKGIVVVGDDHRGHGKTAQLHHLPFGFFANHHGWDKIVNDEKLVNDYIQKKYQNLPIFMLGHSMGSFMARTYAIKYSETINGLIVMGTGEHSTLACNSLGTIARIDQLIFGPKRQDKLIWKTTFAPLNKAYAKIGNANGNEWLTRDVDIQLEFKNNPLNAGCFTTSAFKDLTDGMKFVAQKKHIKLMRQDLPIFLVAGDRDPVGNYGKMVEKVQSKFISLGYKSKIKIYPNLRHEILNEPEKLEVDRDLVEFINQNL
ncbi:alpha/beta fold hydrolase [Williamsoniiplasma lucivorax]|uniref:Lysophospholipase n=1 Tax=Williamsoniiplasma lucivorax TaxID=209274 RepID=A0A2S5R9T3_9MOLU|nr:alpha/beta fold hydrolase [Williamsoniiplasma lucivorax]PPE04086.1 lysophospholipase [Williamsoniiplasma lucivorax]